MILFLLALLGLAASVALMAVGYTLGGPVTLISSAVPVAIWSALVYLTIDDF